MEYENDHNIADPVSERGVIAGVFTYGANSYADVVDIVTPRTFTVVSNSVIWSCFEYLFKENDAAHPDYPSVMSAAQALGVNGLLEKPEEVQHLRALMNMPVRQENVRRLAGRIRKLEIARLLYGQLGEAQKNVAGVTGDEPIDTIRGMAEAPIFDLTSLLTGTDSNDAELIGSGATEYVQYLMDNPREQIGIATGLKLYDFALGGGLRPNSLDIIAARMKVGKAAPLDSLVQTPRGPVKMGEVGIGSLVCTPTGVTSVKGVFPQGYKDIYRVVFADGDSTECCLEHLWEVRHWRSKKSEVRSLGEIKDDLLLPSGQAKWSVRLPEHCYRDHQPVPISPYVLGVLIGDGSFRNGSVVLTSADKELVQYANAALDKGFRLSQFRPIEYRLTEGRTGKKSAYISALRVLGLWDKNSHEKFIPECYLNNSWGVRADLLRGLMDTDGGVDKRGNCDYSTVSQRLAKDVKELVQSLGGLCSISKKTTKCKGKSFSSFLCRVRFNDPSQFFSLERKKSRCRKRKKPELRRRIVSVEFVGKKEAQCIWLGTPDGLYLTNDHIVTHNTQIVDNVGLYIARQGIPVLNIDTEMTKKEHQHRLIANIAGVEVRDIETGKCGIQDLSRAQVLKASKELETLPYHYRCVIGMEFEDVLALMRRWVTRKVGLDENGQAKPCVIIYDYLKLLSADSLSKNMQEYQQLGFVTIGLKNFMGRYGVACLCFAQANREGIDREDTGVIGGSDRIAQYATSVFLYKWKTPEERAEAQGDATKYTHKLVHLISRHGEGLQDGDYINIQADYKHARIIEGPTRNQLGEGRTELGEPKGIRVDDTTGQDTLDFGSAA